MHDKRIPFEEVVEKLSAILLKLGFDETSAARCANMFATNSLEGIYSHGLNRFPRFVEYVKKGLVNVDAKPKKIAQAGALEQWDGNLAAGPLNATAMTNRSIELAQKYGLGCIGLRNTNHWMRGGTYGWQAAKKGYAFMGWTNTIANMPAWGAKDCKLGNNPFVIAIPYNNEAIVLDMAMSQFSYGKMEDLALKNQELSLFGGINKKGEFTKNPKEILETRRPLPIGYWKGSGLSLLLDLLATILSAGLSTSEITSQNQYEYGISQVFICFDLKKLSNFPSIQAQLNDIIEDLKQSIIDDSTDNIRYPGERIEKVRYENLKNGIPVNFKIWKEIYCL